MSEMKNAPTDVGSPELELVEPIFCAQLGHIAEFEALNGQELNDVTLLQFHQNDTFVFLRFLFVEI
jgi:hypothetical protein